MTEKKKTRTGAWQPGQSGNPSGRKPGVEKVRQLLDPHREELVSKAVSMALEGDAAALRMCLDRVSPLPRSESPRVVIPGFSKAKTLGEKSDLVICAAGSGSISPDVAATFLGAIAAMARVSETDELSRRIAALESKGSRS